MPTGIMSNPHTAATAITSGLRTARVDAEGVVRRMCPADLPDPLIRASGEAWPSGFLPWQPVYAGFVFVAVCWPASPGLRPVRHSRPQPWRASLRPGRADDMFNDLPGLLP